MAFIFHHQIPNNSLSLAVLAGIAEAALVTSREQEGNIKKTKNNIWLDFFHFDQRSFPFSSGIHGGILDHVELDFWKNINPHCLQAPKGDPPPHLLDLWLVDIQLNQWVNLLNSFEKSTSHMMFNPSKRYVSDSSSSVAHSSDKSLAPKKIRTRLQN